MKTIDRNGFDGLPLLLTFSQVREWTGLGRESIDALVESGELVVSQIGGKGWRRFHKSSVGKICFGAGDRK